MAFAGDLYKNKNFVLLLGVQTLSVLGDAFSTVAVPLLALHATGSVAQMGVLTALTGVASVVTGTFAGGIVDRFDRRRVLVVCDVGRFLLYGLIPVLWWVTPVIWPLYVIVPLAAVLGMVFNVAYVTVLPSIVDPGDITRANGILYGIFAVAGVAGPALAGVVSGAYGPAAAIGLDSVTFLVSAFGLRFIRLRPYTREKSGGRLAGARFLLGNPVLRTMTILLTALIFLTAGLDDLVVFHLKQNLEQPDAVVGYVLGGGAIGTIVGSMAVARVRGRLGFGPTWLLSTTLAGLAVVAIALSGGVAAIGALMALFSLAITVGAICSMSLRQEITPAHLLGRVTAAFWTIHYALGPLGATLATWTAAGRGVAPVVAVMGAGLVLTAVGGLFSPVRRSGL
ncbi:MFS transporter [Herbidospora sp. NEAU-GS84]|uniref:MFS transporter n=1 Tax=Herbidospora solisilvae TaxID=2696284 RepID=A0A7C9J2I4_9ACTN|nr:MFS transporter [Herbidospora solisilvae]NAS22766.1 MFS transporter [Herbidospora solisilvae]